MTARCNAAGGETLEPPIEVGAHEGGRCDLSTNFRK